MDESNIVNELMKKDAEKICFDVRGHSFLQTETAICQPLLWLVVRERARARARLPPPHNRVTV